MPLNHAVETVRGILIDRLDSALPDLERIALAVASAHIPDPGTRQELAIQFIQAAQVRLFPDEFGDGEPYTPDPDGRMDVPPPFTGLIPRRPTTVIYARSLLKGQQSPAATLTMPDGERVLTDDDLAVLGQRQERRVGRM